MIFRPKLMEISLGFFVEYSVGKGGEKNHDDT